MLDWWAFGIIIHEILTGLNPFNKEGNLEPFEILENILNKPM